MWVLAILALTATILMIFLVVTYKGMDLKSKEDFIQELNKRGYIVQRIEQIKDDNKEFGVPRQFIVTEKAVFDVYEFSNAEEAKNAVSYISPSGSSIKTPKWNFYISWGNHPHYYSSGNFIVLYVGRDPKVLLDMRSLMGKQIAGAKWYEVLLSRRGR